MAGLNCKRLGNTRRTLNILLSPLGHSINGDWMYNEGSVVAKLKMIKKKSALALSHTNPDKIV
jgi:hypothetical protein